MSATSKSDAQHEAHGEHRHQAHGRHSSPDLYTKPELRERLKDEIEASDKGGAPGQWSARKAQILANEYEAAGGGYTTKQPSETQQHLQEWTEQDWTTADGKQARRDGETARYLPEEAWERLTPAERRATDEKKRRGSRRGEQRVPNTPAAKAARKEATEE